MREHQTYRVDAYSGLECVNSKCDLLRDRLVHRGYFFLTVQIGVRVAERVQVKIIARAFQEEAIRQLLTKPPLNHVRNPNLPLPDMRVPQTSLAMNARCASVGSAAFCSVHPIIRHRHRRRKLLVLLLLLRRHLWRPPSRLLWRLHHMQGGEHSGPFV